MPDTESREYNASAGIKYLKTPDSIITDAGRTTNTFADDRVAAGGWTQNLYGVNIVELNENPQDEAGRQELDRFKREPLPRRDKYKNELIDPQVKEALYFKLTSYLDRLYNEFKTKGTIDVSKPFQIADLGGGDGYYATLFAQFMHKYIQEKSTESDYAQFAEAIKGKELISWHVVDPSQILLDSGQKVVRLNEGVQADIEASGLRPHWLQAGTEDVLEKASDLKGNVDCILSVNALWHYEPEVLLKALKSQQELLAQNGELVLVTGHFSEGTDKPDVWWYTMDDDTRKYAEWRHADEKTGKSYIVPQLAGEGRLANTTINNSYFLYTARFIRGMLEDNGFMSVTSQPLVGDAQPITQRFDNPDDAHAPIFDLITALKA